MSDHVLHHEHWLGQLSVVLVFSYFHYLSVGLFSFQINQFYRVFSRSSFLLWLWLWLWLWFARTERSRWHITSFWISDFLFLLINCCRSIKQFRLDVRCKIRKNSSDLSFPILIHRFHWLYHNWSRPFTSLSVLSPQLNRLWWLFCW